MFVETAHVSCIRGHNTLNFENVSATSFGVVIHIYITRCIAQKLTVRYKLWDCPIKMAQYIHTLRHMDFKLMIITPLTFRYAVTRDNDELITPDPVHYRTHVHGYNYYGKRVLLFPGAAHFKTNKDILDFYYEKHTVDQLMREACVLESIIKKLRLTRERLKDDRLCTEYKSTIEYNADIKERWVDICFLVAAYNCVIFIINFIPVTYDSEPFAGTAYIDSQMKHMMITKKLVVA